MVVLEEKGLFRVCIVLLHVLVPYASEMRAQARIGILPIATHLDRHSAHHVIITKRLPKLNARSCSANLMGYGTREAKRRKNVKV